MSNRRQNMVGNRRAVMQAIFDIQKGNRDRAVHLYEIRKQTGLKNMSVANALNALQQLGCVVRVRWEHYTLDGSALQHIDMRLKTKTNQKQHTYAQL